MRSLLAFLTISFAIFLPWSQAAAGGFATEYCAPEGTCTDRYIRKTVYRRGYVVRPSYDVHIQKSRFGWRKRRVMVSTGRHGSHKFKSIIVRKRVVVRPIRYHAHRRAGVRGWTKGVVVVGHRDVWGN